MNLNKMLAALMVAAMSLTLAPMATANHLTCPTGASGDPINLGVAEGVDARLTDATPAGGSRTYDYDLSARDADEVFQMNILEPLGEHDVKVTVYEWTGGSTSCHAGPFSADDVADGPQGENFDLDGGKRYLIQIEDADTESPSVGEQFELRTAPKVV